MSCMRGLAVSSATVPLPGNRRYSIATAFLGGGLCLACTLLSFLRVPMDLDDISKWIDDSWLRCGILTPRNPRYIQMQCKALKPREYVPSAKAGGDSPARVAAGEANAIEAGGSSSLYLALTDVCTSTSSFSVSLSLFEQAGGAGG